MAHDHCLGGRLCCEDTQDTHGDVVRLAERPQDKASVDTCNMHTALGCRRSPPHTHLLLAPRLPLALLYGHLQPQVIPTADPFLLFGPWRQAAGEGQNQND